jgi:hypothetical protein
MVNGQCGGAAGQSCYSEQLKQPTLLAKTAGLITHMSSEHSTPVKNPAGHVMPLLGRWLAALALLVGSVVPGQDAAAAPTPPDPRFGLVESFVNPAAASEAGAGYTRIILRWDVIQPGGRLETG